MIRPYLYLTLLFIGLVANCEKFVSTEELNQSSYISLLDNSERKYYVDCLKDIIVKKQKWPAILFLHGDGERGDGLDELVYTRTWTLI